MITNLKSTIWAIALLFSVASVMVLSSCGDESEPEPDPVAPTASYTDTEVSIGSEGELIATSSGDTPITWSIKDDGGAGDFVSINASTGTLSVAKESKIGEYAVVVNASNAAGNVDATANITIAISDDFDPRGKSLEWRLFMNQSENVELVGLDGIPDLPIANLVLPVGWPDASTPAEDLWKYGVMTGVQGLLLEVPGDEACTGSGDSKKLSIGEDLSVSVICSEGEPALVGTSAISYVDDKFVFTMEIDFIPGVSLPYQIDDARFEEFQDGYTDPLNPTVYPALLGTVIGMTTPTDLTDENTIQDFTKWAYPNVDIVMEDITE